MVFIDGFGELGRIMAPIVVGFMNDQKLNPVILCAIVNILLGILPILPLRETFKQN